jgi:molybdenum cofactor cytidylyltransferase
MSSASFSGSRGVRRLHGVVLAAGSGRRMGGPKAFVSVDGKTLLERHLERLHAAGCISVLAVVRPSDAEVARTVSARVRRLSGGLTLVAATTPSQAASLVVAVRHLVRALSDDDAVAITPVDLLPPRVDTMLALASTLDDALAVTPTYRGRGGHPALVRPEVLAPYVRGETAPLRDVLGALGASRTRLAVDDPAIAGDFDWPSDLAGAFEPLSLVG